MKPVSALDQRARIKMNTSTWGKGEGFESFPAAAWSVISMESVIDPETGKYRCGKSAGVEDWPRTMARAVTAGHPPNA
jgi:hypothetical protein